ncbi:MAG: glycosyltransferase family 4 protein [Halobacteriovoraceae bacterium]|nr:glycosyltransferase family 4 protein [Halobacteriovoraceae bacterium]
MKIWVTEIGEPLPVEGNVRLHRYGEFTKYLAAQGHEVTWWTSTFSHTPKIQVFDKDTTKVVDGVKIHFIKGPGYKRNVSFARIKHHGDFAEKFIQRAKKETDLPDIIISPVPTIIVPFRVSKFCKQKNIPHVIDIRDSWPDDIVRLAPSFLRPLAKIMLSRLYRQMDVICKNATAIMGNAQPSIDYGLAFAERTQNELDYFFPLGYREFKIPAEKLETTKQWYESLKLKPESFKICFFGTIGRFFNLDTVIKAARQLKSDNIEFILGGDGEKLSYYKKQAQDLSNVHFPGWLERAQMTYTMDNCQAGLAPYISGHDFALTNKIYEYMAGALPLISSVENLLPQILEENRAGFSYDSDDAKTLAEAIKKLLDTDIQKEFSQNARKLYLDNFQMDKTFKDAESHLQKIITTFSDK